MPSVFFVFFFLLIKNFLHCVNAENVCVIFQSYLVSETFTSVSAGLKKNCYESRALGWQRVQDGIRKVTNSPF